MREIFSNEPVENVLAFRESGYADKIIDQLRCKMGDGWDLYLYFELSRWKGNKLKIVRSTKKKVVICIGDESPRIDYSFLDEVDIIFRMYLPKDRMGKVYHIPVGPSKHFSPSQFVPISERRHNVFFSGNLHRGRADFYRALTRIPLPFSMLHRLRGVLGERFDDFFPDSIIRFSSGFHSGIPAGEYARVLGESKIVLCPAGIENSESMRHFEAASLGCIVVTTVLPSATVYHNAPFVTLPSWRDLHQIVNQLLREPNRMLDLHAETLEWWESTACSEAVVRQMFARMSKVTFDGRK